MQVLLLSSFRIILLVLLSTAFNFSKSTFLITAVSRPYSRVGLIKVSTNFTFVLILDEPLVSAGLIYTSAVRAFVQLLETALLISPSTFKALPS